MRLGKFLAHAGAASRRGAEDLVRAGRVTVGGTVVEDPACNVEERDVITVDGARLEAESLVVYAVHKPLGVVSTAKDTHGRPTVVSLVDDGRRLYPVGRLDVDSTGLLLLTNDGALAHRLTHPSFGVVKRYRARVSRPPVRSPALQRLRQGVRLEDGMTAPAGVKRLTPDVIELELREGRKRQVRRMCDEVGHPVRELTRVAFGPLSLGRLPLGRARKLSPGELTALRRAAQA